MTAPPKTLDELKAAAKKIKAQNPGVAGFVARTGKSAAVTQFSSFLYSFGGELHRRQRQGDGQHPGRRKRPTPSTAA